MSRMLVIIAERWELPRMREMHRVYMTERGAYLLLFTPRKSKFLLCAIRNWSTASRHLKFFDIQPHFLFSGSPTASLGARCQGRSPALSARFCGQLQNPEKLRHIQFLQKHRNRHGMNLRCQADRNSVPVPSGTKWLSVFLALWSCSKMFLTRADTVFRFSKQKPP